MNQKVVNYLLDSSKHLNDDELYQLSLFLEPRGSRFCSRTSVINFPQGISPTHYQQDKPEKPEKP